MPGSTATPPTRRRSDSHSSASSSAPSLASSSDSETSSHAAETRKEEKSTAGKKKKKTKAGRRARRRSEDDESDHDHDDRPRGQADNAQDADDGEKEEITFEEFSAAPPLTPHAGAVAGPSSKPGHPAQGGKKIATATSKSTKASTNTVTASTTTNTTAKLTAGTGKSKEEREAERKEKRRAKNRERRKKVRESTVGTGSAGKAVTTGEAAASGEAAEDGEKDGRAADDGVEAQAEVDEAGEDDPANDDIADQDAAPITSNKTPSNRQLYLSRLTSDPSFTPRVGTFWTHDERHYSKGKFGEDGEFAGLRGMSGWWRGAGGPERGGRGRGRGFGFPRGAGAARGRGGMGATTGQSRAEERPAVLEQTAESTPQDQAVGTSSVEPPAPKADSASWGHDAYEKMEQAEQRRTEAREKRRVQQALRGGAVPGGFVSRGRGRGRGGQAAWGYPQGHGFAGQQGVQVNGGGFKDYGPVEDGNITVKLPQAAAGINVPLAPTAADFLVEPTETISAAPIDPNVVVVKLPATNVAPVPVPTSVAPLAADHGEDSETVANLNLQAEIEFLKSQQATIAQKERQLDEELKRLEIGSRRVESTAVPVSENGSMSSAPASSSYIAQHNGMQYGMPPPPTFVPPGIAMAENGSFFEIATGQPVVFVASNSPAPQGNYPSGPYPPQPYYPNQQPGPYFRGGYPGEQHPHLSRGDSFGTFTPPPCGRDSPLGSYPSQSVPPGYFAPPRPAGKIQIRAPSSHEVAILKNPGKLGSNDHSQEPHMIPEGQAYSMDNPYAYQGQMMQPMVGQGYYPGMPMHQGYPPQGGYDYGYGQY